MAPRPRACPSRELTASTRLTTRRSHVAQASLVDSVDALIEFNLLPAPPRGSRLTWVLLLVGVVVLVVAFFAANARTH